MPREDTTFTEDFEGRNPSEWAQFNEECEQEWRRSLADVDLPGLAVEGWITIPARAFPGEREALVPVAERLLKSVLDLINDGGVR